MRPFTVNIPDSEIDDLRNRIKNNRWPDEIQNSGWQFGASLHYMQSLVDYWLTKFNWRDIEKEINSYPNYIAEIDGFDIHFIHIKSKQKNKLPLIITHGWPGSFLEMLKLIPLLNENPDQSFDLVIPSIPGFGFSQRPSKTGCNLWFIAELWHKLMISLGYDKFIAQGGDFGAGVSTTLALKHPENVMGIHLNYIPGSYFPYLDKNEMFTDEEIKSQQDVDNWYRDHGAYAHQHKTKPLTLAYGLNDSPVGLCAWIVEKFFEWSDCNGNIENVFTKDELLANVSLYWFTKTIHSSIRLYNENSKEPLHFGKNDFIKVPVGIARFLKEDPFPMRKFIERGYNVRHWTEFDKGGHFAAMEQPELLAKDVIEFSKKVKHIDT
jgi:pimeloyl-ACP methyl ester carboxylesterase